MRFGEPLYFNLIWLLIAVIVFLSWSLRKKWKLTNEFCSAPLVPRLLDPRIRTCEKTKSVLIVLAVFFISLALTQPKWGYHWEDLHREGVDLMVVVDVSNSMLAEDIKPNRLERAKYEIADLLQMMDGDRIGLVVFAGTAYVQCPLTLDYSAAQIFLNSIDTELIPVQGTSIGNALRITMKAFSEKEKKSRAVLLITDGEDQGGDALEVAREAAEQEIKIFTIGIGGEMGAPIPSRDPGGGFKKDSGGEVILTRLDEKTLQEMAIRTGGTYVRSVTGDMDLKKIYLESIKRKVEKKELKAERRKLWQERFQWPAFLALICLAWEFLVRPRVQVRQRVVGTP